MPYAAQSDAENLFGVANIARWSNLDNTTTTANATRVAAAQAYADGYIDDRLRNGNYRVPLTLNATLGGTMSTITDLAARLVGCWLYESRGMADTQDESGEFDATRNAISRHRKYVDTVLGMINAGKMRIPCSYIRNYTTQPAILG